MGRRFPVLCLGVVAILAVPAAAGGQDRWPVSLDVMLGLGAGTASGEYRDNDRGLIGDVLVGVRVRPTDEGALVAGASLGVQGTGPTTDICIQTADGGCVPNFPQFTVLSVLGGWETEPDGFRVLTGPAAVRAYGDWKTIRFAWMARAGVVLPLAWHISAIASLRGFVVPSYQGDSFRLIGGAVGLRLR